MRSIHCLVCIFGAVLLSVPATASDNKQAQDQFSNLHFTVVKDYNNKPVRNASVILHPVNKDGSQAKGGFQLKTDGEGKAISEGIPYGMLRVQILAPGFQTFGEDYRIDKPDVDIQIRLKRPSEQLSVYDKPAKQQAPPAKPPAEPKPQ
ncbi:MAG TPA: carboxypeptidase-like regulatory domain-containing protein [Candidatus Eisenbacteria bacterium]|nr:carboxypeptidase-like regulatory domain-containing protein [Candidatus Eisenbacteria bacterium]